jgi:glycosyltransferase involved in cell wall biosynthesis
VKTLIVKSNYGRTGGPETLLAAMLKQWDRDQFDYMLVALSHDTRQPLPFVDGESFEKYPEKFHRIPWNGLKSLPAAVWLLFNLVRKVRPKAVYTHDMRANLVAFFVSWLSSVPWIAHVHGWLGKTAIWKTQVYEWIDQKIIHRAKKVLVGSEYLKDRMLQVHRVKQVQVIPNSLDMDLYPREAESLRESLFPDFEGIVIGTVCRLHPGKGVHILIEAFANLIQTYPEARCLVVGEGPEKPRLQQMARELGVEDRVVITGYVDAILPYLRSMDIYVLASLQESLPLSVLEALALEIPAVGTRVGDVGRVLDFGKEHLLVPPGNPVELCEILIPLAQNPELRHSLGEKGKEVVETGYSIPVAIEMTEKVLEENGRRPR